MCWAISWKNVDVVRPQPGQAETWGRNERSPSDWRTCWAISTSRSRGAPGSGVSETRIVSPMPSLSRIASPAVEATMPFVAHAGLGQAEVERVVGAGAPGAGRRRRGRGRRTTLAERMIRSWPQAGRLGQLGRAHRRLEHRLDHHVAGVARRGGAGVGVHQLGQERLVERAPVDADADRLVVVDGDLDDRREVLVVALRADVARVDPVLGERRRHLRVLDQQLVAVVVEVADDRDVDAEAADLADHLRDGRRGGVRVDRDPDELRARRARAARPGSPSRRRRRCRCWSSTGRRPGGPSRRARRRRRR